MIKKIYPELLLTKLQCPQCGSAVVGPYLPCPRCSVVPFTLKEGVMPKAFGERIFNYPAFYETKVKLLGWMNGIDRDALNPLVKGKQVLDVGCGSWQYLYDPAVTAFRVGMDMSLPAITRSSERYPDSIHFVRSVVDPLPFRDRSFEVSVLSFLLHHLNRAQWEPLLREIQRVTSSRILIFDHIRHDHFFPRAIQTAWWKGIDGGSHYASQAEWEETLGFLGHREMKRIGALFGNIGIFVITLL